MTGLLIVALQLFSPVDPAAIAAIHQQRITRLVEGHGAQSIEVRNAHRDLGLFWLRNGRPELAEPWLRLAKPDREVIPFLAEAVAAQNRPAEAEQLFGECRDKALCVAKLAQYADERGDADKAVALYRQALTLQPTGSRHNDLALALRSAGHPKEAEAVFRKALPLQEKEFGPRHPETASTRNNLASLLLASSRAAEAEALQRRALADLEHALGPLHARTGLAVSNLADIVMARGRSAEAKVLYRRASLIFRSALPAGHPWIAEAEANAARP